MRIGRFFGAAIFQAALACILCAPALAAALVEPALVASVNVISDSEDQAIIFDELPILPGGADGGVDPASRFLLAMPDEIEPYFDLYLYVSKAARGPIAQHMFAYRRLEDGRLVLVHDWLVSTGRERREKYFTTTPVGLFMLDPDRFFADYWSRTWDTAMPWAMFLDYTRASGRRTGIAFHAVIANTKIARLGQRDSGGCIRLAPEAAQALFEEIQTNYRGDVPIFDTDPVSGGTSRQGLVRYATDGTVATKRGYRVILMIEDYGGQSGPPAVADLAQP